MRVEAMASAPPDPLREAAQQFEALFVRQLLSAMRQSGVRGGALAPSRAETDFRDLLDGEFAQRIAERGGIGLADMLCRTLGANETPGGTQGANR